MNDAESFGGRFSPQDVLFRKEMKMAPKEDKMVVWQCRYCGTRMQKWQSNGMPDPASCLRNGKMGGPKGPHRWVKIMVK